MRENEEMCIIQYTISIKNFQWGLRGMNSVRNAAWLSPSLMCISAWDSIGDIRALENCGAELLHVDVMDGAFVPNLMLGTESVKQLRKLSGIPLDIHLMIEDPDKKIEWFEPQPGEYVTVHVESTKHLQRALDRIRLFGAHPAVALNPATPVCMIEDILGEVDAVVMMTVSPGFSGQKLVPHTLSKLQRMRSMLDRAGLERVRLAVDGNVSFESAGKMRAAGADVFVCGTSSIFAAGGAIESNAARLRRCIADGELF